MSGADQERKMKRRKTRAERNQMSRHHLQYQKKQKKLTKSLKDTEPSQNTIYTLRSGRSSHTTAVTRDDRKACTGAITQGRLTRSLGKLTFTNSKTSDWIKRGPISESDAMKEKVENDIKRILRLAERSTLTSNVDLLPDADRAAHKINKTTELEPDAMEVDCSVNNSTTADKSTAETSHQACIMGAVTVPASSTTTIASAAVQVEVTPAKSGSSFSWASTTPTHVDESLQLEPPIQEIADKILKELKPKFARLFPNRDIEMEVCSDLQKLLNHSCPSQDVQADSSLNTFLTPEYHDPAGMCTPAIGMPTPSASTLSMCRPLSFQTGQFYSQLQHFDRDAKPESNGSVVVQDSLLYPCLGTYSSTAFHKDGATPAFTTTFVVPDLQEADDVIKINRTVGGSEINDYDILSTARYSAFLASARELELEQERLLHQVNTFEGVAPSHTSDYHQCIEQDNFLRQSCGLKPEEPSSNTSKDVHSSSHSFDWRNISAARVLDFSQPSGSYHHQAAAFSCPSRNISDRLYPNVHLTHPAMAHSRTQFDYLHNNPSEQPQCSFAPQSCSSASRYSYDLSHRYPCPETCSSSVASFMRRKTAAPNLGSSLAQSRLNFQNALKFACRPDGVGHAKPTEEMDTDRCDDFVASIQRNTSPLNSYDFQHQRHVMARPLSELRTHQADLQQQARDFLDNLNSCRVKPRLDFLNCQPNHTRHLFRMASPDSNGSPVWGMLPVMKDFG